MSTEQQQAQKQQQKEMWSAASEAWEQADDWLEDQLGSLSSWMVEAAEVAPGQRVLDLACGTGQPAVKVAARVGAGGKVIATDLSPAMVAATRRKAERLGLGNVEVREMDAERLDFPDGAFDAVTCRFGLMFCPEPARAAAEIHRVLRAGGRIALTVWDEPSRNPFFTAIGQIVGKYVPTPPPDPAAPGVFRLAAPGELARILAGAGFRDVKVEARPMTFSYQSPEAYWDMQSQLAAPIRAAIRTLPPDQVATLRAEAIELGRANATGGPVRFAATPLGATAVR